MKRNVGNAERALRGIAAVAMAACAVMAPLPLAVRLGAFGGLGGYLLISALAGTCLGYKLMGVSTCPVETRQ